MKNFLNVGNSVSFFFLFLLILSVIIIFSFDKNVVSPYVSPGDIPKIELNNFTIYQVNNKNLLMKLNARNAKQFDKFEEFYDVLLERLSNNILDTITAPTALKKGDSIFFDNGVNDVRDGYNIYTTKGVYRIDKNIMEGDGFFSIKGNFQDIKGDNIYYDAKNGITKAENIEAKLTPQRKKK
ncbi:hypothetical protein CCY99_02620 [Helicobacter sp. 16-1353]|uniref:hypothetical protein n=1 Tax=Helicobacter sp. 16-1353 TaxID=2004996 RepID=UPI000DCED3A9|nr:hypothetical protein [Helicobacter sp. 16-1353]RAX54676.1 hypothetical protein CCY99_02620 [Helicobacter sp. 16-1353]